MANENKLRPAASIVREVRQRMRRRASEIRLSQTSGEDAAFWSGLQQTIQTARRAALQVGTLPAQPATLRARFGMVFVRLVQRALFWYTPQLTAAQIASSAALDEIARALEALSRRARQTEAYVAALELELSRIHGRQVSPCEPLEDTPGSDSAAGRA